MKNFNYLIKARASGWLFLLGLFFLISGNVWGQTFVSANFSDFGFSSPYLLPSGNIDSNISFTTEKNSSSTNPTFYEADGIRFYYHSGGNGGSITLHVANGVSITKVEMYAFSGSYIPTVKYNVDGGTDGTASLSGTTYTIDGVSAESSLKIRNGNTSNTQLRITGLTVWYDSGSEPCEIDAPVGEIDGFTPECDYSFVSFVGDDAPSGVTYYWQTSDSGTDTTNDAAEDLDVYESGDFYVRAFNGECWSDAVGPFHVDINHAPEVAIEPQDKTAVDGGNASFSVEMEADGDYIYQWYVSTDDGDNWQEIEGEESAELNLSGVSLAMNGYQYSVYIVNDCGDVTSEAAALSVVEGPCFEEDFSGLTNGGNTAATGPGSPSTSEWTGNANFPTTVKAYEAGGAVKLGTSSLSGSIESRELTEIGSNVSVKIMVKGWSSVEGNLVVTLGDQTETLTYTAKMTDAFEQVSVDFTDVPAGSKLKIATSSKRAFIDDVQIFCEPIEEEVNIWENGYWSEGVPVKLNSGRKLIFRSDFNSLAGAMSDGSGTGNTNKYGRIWGTSAEVEAGVNVVFNSDHSLILDNELIVDSDNGASLTFKTGAILSQKNNAAVNQGEINFEREFYMSPKKNRYNLVSSPVIDFFMQDIYDGSPKIYKYAEKADKFNNAGAGEYIAGKGYRVNEKEEVFATKNANYSYEMKTGVFTGVPANGKMRYKVTVKGEGYNLIGNPYPSILKLDKLYNGNEDLINETFFFMDNRGAKGGDHHATYNVLTETGVAAMAPIEAGLDERIPTNEVAVGTGFFVSAKKQGKVKFANNMRLKTDSDEPEFFGKTQTKDRYWLTMTTPENLKAMTAVVYFGAGDNGFAADDSKSLYNNDVLYTLVDDNQLVIQGKAAFEKSDVVAVGIKVTEDGTHSIALAKQEGVFENGQTVYLRDKQTGAVHNLSAQPYNFTASVGEYNNRFEIIYNNFGLNNDVLTQNNINIEKKNQNIVITSTMENIAAVEIFNLTGAPVYSKSNINANQFSVPVSMTGNQIIVVKVKTVNGKIVNKKFINQ